MPKSGVEYYHLQSEDFLSLKSSRDLALLLKTEPQQLTLLAHQPQYRSFTVPKRGGGLRPIDAPVAYLKKIQSRLNAFLQSVYYFHKTPAAYGYIQSSIHEIDARNIVTNARKHVGCSYLLNLDLKDFFPSIRFEQVLSVFQSEPFLFRENLAELLACLTTFQGALPVGAPTSPVLSNFVARSLDLQLQELSETKDWVYTRYVDDLSISTTDVFYAEDLANIQALIEEEGFVINMAKAKLFGPDHEKTVTGIRLDQKKITLADGFFTAVAGEIDQLKNIIQVQHIHGELQTRWVEHFKQQIKGKLSFISFVLGKQSKRYQTLKDRYYEAIHPPEEEFGSVSWRGFPYF